MHFGTYREFYPKSLISMGEKDRTTINDQESRLTHWLVSLEGYPRPEDEYYLWEVSIYPSDIDGSFNWNTPLYRSSLFESFDKAYEAAIRLEENCQNAEVSMIDYIERIN